MQHLLTEALARVAKCLNMLQFSRQAGPIAGEAAAVSAQLHALAEALQVVTANRSGDDIVAEMRAKADALLAQLPASYQQPLLSRDSLTEAQVRP